jgi:hypothetical protein
MSSYARKPLDSMAPRRRIQPSGAVSVADDRLWGLSRASIRPTVNLNLKPIKPGQTSCRKAVYFGRFSR